MAIQSDFCFNTQYGVEAIVKNCYIKVSTVEVSKSNGNVRVLFFKKQNDKLLEEIVYPFPISLDGPNFIQQAYLHLKTLPEFADAIDC